MAADAASARSPTGKKPHTNKKTTCEAPLHHPSNRLPKKIEVRTSNDEPNSKGCGVMGRTTVLFFLTARAFTSTCTPSPGTKCTRATRTHRHGAGPSPHYTTHCFLHEPIQLTQPIQVTSRPQTATHLATSPCNPAQRVGRAGSEHG